MHFRFKKPIISLNCPPLFLVISVEKESYNIKTMDGAVNEVPLIEDERYDENEEKSVMSCSLDYILTDKIGQTLSSLMKEDKAVNMS